jgi:hypothetical protein
MRCAAGLGAVITLVMAVRSVDAAASKMIRRCSHVPQTKFIRPTATASSRGCRVPALRAAPEFFRPPTSIDTAKEVA